MRATTRMPLSVCSVYAVRVFSHLRSPPYSLSLSRSQSLSALPLHPHAKELLNHFNAFQFNGHPSNVARLTISNKLRMESGHPIFLVANGRYYTTDFSSQKSLRPNRSVVFNPSGDTNKRLHSLNFKNETTTNLNLKAKTASELECYNLFSQLTHVVQLSSYISRPKSQ